jgi:2-keto-3-deoxy-L-rhamnonate aldolase RhmA
VPGAFGGSPEACRHYTELGFRFIAAASDVNMMAAGAKVMQP